jgi:hypothetical protein
MAAVDETGTVAALFAITKVEDANPIRIEVAVVPEQALTTEIVCLVAVAGDLLRTFFLDH